MFKVNVKSMFILLLVSSIGIACGNAITSNAQNSATMDSQKDLSQFQKAYFASGCFWCVEAVYESVEGVEEAISGYAGGHTDNPTYQSIGTGQTGHAETVEVYYDSTKVSFATLLAVFFGSGDPTTLNRQGPDAGTQYRSIIFYQNEKEKKAAIEMVDKLTSEKVFENPIVTQIVPFLQFYEAEEYHQDFEKRNPNQSYVRAVSIPRLNRFKAAFPELLKSSEK